MPWSRAACRVIAAIAVLSTWCARSDTGSPAPEFVSSLTTEEREWLTDAPTVRFAGDPDWLPFEAIDERGRHSGIVSALLERISAVSGLQFEMARPTSWPEVLRLASEDAVDVISGDAADSSLSQNFAPTRSYLSSKVIIVMEAGHPPVNHLGQIKEQRIGLVRGHGYTNELFFRHPTQRFAQVDTVAAGLQALRAGRLDALLLSNVAARYNLERLGYADLSVVGHTAVFMNATFFVARRQPHLRNVIEKALFSISHQERNAIFDRWMKEHKATGAALATLSMSASERAWLDANAPFRFAGDPDWLPYEAFDNEGNYIGIVADYVRTIEQLLGTHFESVQTASWSESVELTNNGKIDVLSETTDSDLGARLTFTDAYLASPIVMVMDREQDFVAETGAIVDMRVGVVKDYGYVSQIRRAYPGTLFVDVPSLREGLYAVSTGEVDVMLCALAQCNYHIPREHLDNIRVVGRTEFGTQLALGVQPGFEPLVPLINRAIRAIGPAQRQQIRSAWSKDPLLGRKDYALLYRGLLAVFAALVVVALWNWRLRVKVRERERYAAEVAAARNEAVAANEAKTQFLASMSHEVRTPMNGVLGMLEVLSHTPLNQGQTQTVGVIRNSAQSLLTIIDDLLDMSRIEGGHLKINEEVTRLSNLIESVVSAHAVAAHKKILDLRVLIEPALNRGVMVDPVRVRQILANFLSNAIKFTERGSVTLIAEAMEQSEAGLRFRLSVIDTGIGIAADNQAKLFTRFAQAEDSTARRYGGSGLGLSICKHLAELMGGQVELDSVPGEGSTIRYEQTAPFAARDSVAVRGIGRRRALVALADSFNRDAAAIYLDALEMTHEQLAPAEMPIESDALKAKVVEAGADLVIADFDPIDVAPSHRYAHMDDLQARLGCPMVRFTRRALPGDSEFGPGFCRISGNPLLPSAFGLAVRVSLGDKVIEDPIEHSAAPPSDVHVLMVEDHPINQHVLRGQLELLGYRCTGANNGQEGLDAWRAGDYDAIITDCAMPVMDGYEMTQTIRAAEVEGETQIPIIGLTASSVPGEAYRCREAGMDDCVLKPVELAQIDSCLSHWLGLRGSRARRESAVREPLDVAYLLRVFHEEARVADVLQQFLRSVRDDIVVVRTAHGSGNFVEMRQKAHHIAGAAVIVSAKRVADRGREISQAPAATDATQYAVLIDALEQAYESFAILAKRWMRRPKTHPPQARQSSATE